MEQQIVEGMQNFDAQGFYSNQQTVAHQPDKFIFDFKSAYPQFTPENRATMVINHRVVLLDPYSAKEFLKVLRDNLDRYEKQFGEIKKPAQLEKAEKQATVQLKQAATSSQKPSYMG